MFFRLEKETKVTEDKILRDINIFLQDIMKQ